MSSAVVDTENVPPMQQAALKSGEKPAMPGKKATGSSGDRKKLQNLQPSGKNKTLLVGADGLLRMTGSASKKEPVKIYEDPAASSTPERKEKTTNSASKATQARVASKEGSIQAAVVTSEGATQVEEADTAQAKAEEVMYAEDEDLPAEYWKELAEKRREALEASLLENEELHTSLTQVEEEKELLVAERDELKSMAEQAEELAKLVKSLVPGDSDNDAEEDEEESEEEKESKD